MNKLNNTRVAIIGLGYVGLPLAVEFGKIFPTVGFDLNTGRINELKGGIDVTLETTGEEMKAAKHLRYTDIIPDIRACNVYIVTVPTPIDAHRQPDLAPLRKASETIGQVISKGDIVIYESTVYPGAVEDDCIPVVERTSGLRFNVDFFAGYSPERINPGDKVNRLTTIKKVTSGSNPETARRVDELYKKIITAGTHLAPSIKIAEAAKVIENTQRDLNIALMNELSVIFNRLDIDTLDVLEAAGTKWNFLPFRPGLVGGHCIGVDPYYLTHKAQAVGYYPEVVLAGRRINDGMGRYVSETLVREMILKDLPVKGANILVLGLTFKENCPDLRNTRVIDVIDELKGYGALVSVADPWADKEQARSAYGIDIVEPYGSAYDAIVLAVAHEEFDVDNNPELLALLTDTAVVYDLKGILPRSFKAKRL